MITIDYRANHSYAIPELAQYFFAEWRAVYDRRRMSLSDVIAACEARAQTQKLPLAFVALKDGVVIGTGCLKYGDFELRPQLDPWLGGLFVLPNHRDQGVATALIQRLLQEARRLDLPVLYLWTASAEALYTKLGWEAIETLDYCGSSASVMKLVL